MNYPQPGDYIDLHTHGARPIQGVFQVETIMAHEERIPEKTKDLAFTYGIHPWYLDESNHNRLLASVIKIAEDPLVIAVGEAGFDKIKGPSMDLQRKTFEEQVIIAEELKKPVVIHCVRAWDELLRAHKRLHPKLPWLVHGFRGNKDLAMQLISKGMYISFWFEFILKQESSELVKTLPKEKIFIETDGAEIDVKDIYNKVSGDLGLGLNGLKKLILDNFKRFFIKR